MFSNTSNGFSSQAKRGSDILIIEDSEFVNDAIKKELERLGHHCIQAFTLEEALQLIKVMENCDFIILDLHLPDAYGEKLFYTIDAQSEAKIIIMTSEEDTQIRSSLFKSGALDYILKDENFFESVLKVDETIRNISENSGFNVLVIDDSALLRKHVEMVLGVRNYTVVQAKTGQEGLNALKENRVNLIILDLELPDMHGTEVLQKLKQDTAFSKIPVIVLSGTNNPELISNVLKGGAADFIQKPFNIEEFVLKIGLWTKLTSKTDEVNYLQQFINEYKHMIDQTKMMAVINTEGIITHVNEKFCQASGYEQDELIGQAYGIIHYPEMLDSVLTALWDTIKDKKTWTGKLKNQNKNGEVFITDTVITPIVDTFGNIIEYIVAYDTIDDE